MSTIKNLIKKIVGERLVLMYHLVLAKLACAVYGNPSSKMTVIGVTGTKGKTSTVNYIWAALNAGDIKTGVLSTVNFRIGDVQEVNDKHMTMPGRFFVQRKLREMVQAGCTHAVVETTSEGIKQHRASCIDYSIAVFTNISPEHLQSHGGSFDNYKQAKGKLFKMLSKHEGDTMILANTDSEYAPYFLSFPATSKLTYSVNADSSANYIATDIEQDRDSVSFGLGDDKYVLNSPGTFNVYNALPAVMLAKHFGVSVEDISNGLANIGTIPGRMEEIVEVGPLQFRVFVDYAHEETSLRAALGTARSLANSEGKVIVLIGGQGGGRDRAKRALMGAAAAELADVVIVANEDPYDDNPLEIINEIADAAESPPAGGVGKVRGENLFPIEDRRDAIKKALSLASDGDVVLITGKGAEQTMIVKGKTIKWDDRNVVRECLIAE